MSHEKLSPRQKMIGMMYLVLTAMLALNVSKDAVEAFKNIDNSLTLTIRNYATKNNLIYQEFESSFAQYPEKTGPYRAKALEVKQRADELFDYLQGLKVEIITEADEPYAILNGNEIYTDTIKRIDDNNVPSQILIGANDDGKAFFLRTAINDYRDWLITEILQGESPILEKGLRESLNTDDKWNRKKKEMEKWPNYNFQALPLVYVITMLSKIQVDVRNAETEALNFLFSQIDKSSFKFNKLQAVVIPKSNYVTIGNNYEATVFISATDTAQQPTITVDNQRIDIDDSGKGLYSVRASSIGPKSYSGVISMQAPDGTVKNYSFSESYNVGEPNVICSPTAMNVMYAGIENPLDVSVPGIDPQDIRVRVVNGSSALKKIKNPKGEFFRGSFAIKPEAAGKDVQVIVSTDVDGKVTNYPPYPFRVKPIPPPEAVLGGRSSGTISRNIAVAQEGVFARLPDFDFDLIYEITGFTMIYTDRMGDKFETSTSSSFTPAQKAILNSLTRGKTLVITDIKAKGPDGNKEVKSIVLKID